MSTEQFNPSVVKTEPLSDEEETADIAVTIKEEPEETRLDHPSEDDDNEHDDEDSDDDDEFYRPPEPRYDKANSLKFRQLCHRFETLWKQKSKKKKPPKEELLRYLISKQLYQYLNGNNTTNVGTSSSGGSQSGYDGTSASTPSQNQRQSIFPLLRLMVPDQDSTRPRLWMKEKTIATTWAAAIGLTGKGSDYKKLVHYNDPTCAGMTACGDISMCVYEVIKKRFPEYDRKDGGVTIGEMNDLFDELAGLREVGQSRGSSNVTATGNSRGSKKMRERWVSKLIAKKFSPIEHKWIVRMLLQRMDLGIGSDSIINCNHEFAADLYSANKNLKTLCATLCDKDFIRRRRLLLAEERDEVDNHNRAQYLPRNKEPATLNNTIDPMLSMRTSFENILTDLQKRHRAYTEVLDQDDPLRTCLALKFPAFTCEVKLDGERLLAHMKKGVVKVHTRNGKWYSNIYSPVLAPFLREAVGDYDVDIILDGEVIAWDDTKKETIPFGDNRRVAKIRKEWMRRNDKLDSKDLNLHRGDDDVNVAPAGVFNEQNQADYERRRDAGSDVWLKYVLFDILYVGGSDAEKLMKVAFSFMNDAERPTATGSILHLDLMKRKRILHTLIRPQENIIEPVETIIVRSDGTCVDGFRYFTSPEITEHGFSPLILDSINFTLDGIIPNITEIDEKRRENGKSNNVIGEMRAIALDKFYADIVTKRCLEGLLFKDLSSPYCFGSQYRKLGYWYKLKDDYSKRGHAADIDVVVIGAQFATGSRNAGYLNSFLVACLDDDSGEMEGTKYMTLCQCNGNVVSDRTLRELLESTGYKLNESGEVTYGSWFKSADIPNFMSRRSFQHSSTATNSGWKPEKKNRPDLWIDPNDSFVLTINSGEITDSKSFQAGVTLRFPRVTSVRAEGFDGDPKSASEVDGVSILHEIYYTRRSQQEAAERESQTSLNSQVQTALDHHRLFFTVEQGLKKSASKKRKVLSKAPRVRAPKINSMIPFESDIFKDKIFTVLDGTYVLDADGLDGQEAKTEGWLDLAMPVRSQQHVVDFIMKHGGSCTLTANQDTDYIIGGRLQDPRVAAYRKSIEGASQDMVQDKSKKGQHLRKIHEIGGIVKWTFLFSTVHRLHNGSDTSKVVPRRHDYIIMSKFAEEKLLKNEDIYGLHLYESTNIVDLKRAMIEVKRQERRSLTSFNGDSQRGKRLRTEATRQVDEKDTLAGLYKIPDPSEMIMLQTSRQKRLFQGNKSMVVYPFIFELDNFTLPSDITAEEQYLNSKQLMNLGVKDSSSSEAMSSLILLTSLGAKITPSFHRGVTHILCHLRQEILVWHHGISESVFTDLKHRNFLNQKLLALNQLDPIDVTLVSPEWIRRQWG